MRDDISYLDKKHGGAKDKDEYDTNLETIERDKKPEKLDSDEEDLINGGEGGEEGDSSQPKNTRATMRQGGTILFTRNHDGQAPARLQDFEIKRMLGKGAFGKVFLVQNKNTQKYYAMKAIRKDVVLE
jgi:hypothetical protein